MSGKLLITGASGFVGYHLVSRAIEQNFEVVAAVRKGSKVDHLKEFPITFKAHSFSHQGKLTEELREAGYTHILHAAGRTRAKDQQEYDQANAELTRVLAESALEALPGLQKFVFISSLAAVGPNTDDFKPISADREPAPVTAYGQSKLKAERLLSKLNGLPLVTLRPTAVYGPREKDLFMIIKSVAGGLEPYIGRGRQVLSFVYVKDLARVAIAALQAEVQAHSAYNISDGKSYERYEFADTIKEVLGKRTIRFHIPTVFIRLLAAILEGGRLFGGGSPVLNREKLNELTAPNWSCSIDKARNDLAYSPSYTLEEGLPETIAWYKKNHWLK